MCTKPEQPDPRKKSVYTDLLFVRNYINFHEDEKYWEKVMLMAV